MNLPFTLKGRGVSKAAATLLGVFVVVTRLTHSESGQGANEAMAAQPELVAQSGHTAKIQGLVFSPDGESLVSTAADNSVRVWNVNTGQMITALNVYGVHDGGLAVAPNRPEVAIRAGTELLVWDWARNRILARTDIEQGHLVQFSFDGALLLTDSDGRVHIRDATTLKVERTINIGQPISALGISRDNAFVAIGSYAPAVADGRLTVWQFHSSESPRDVSTDKQIINRIYLDAEQDRLLAFGPGVIVAARLSVPGPAHITSVDLSVASNLVVVSPSGHTLVTSSLGLVSTDYSIRHSQIDGKPIHVLKGHELPPTAMAFAPGEDVLASGSWDTSIKLWDLTKGVLIRSLESHTAPPPLKALATTPKGDWLVTGGTDRIPVTWNLRTGAPAYRPERLSNWINSVAISDDGAVMVAADYQGSVHLYGTASRGVGFRLPGPVSVSAGDETKVVYSEPADSFVYVSVDQVARVWSRSQQKIVAQTKVGNARSLAVSPMEPVVAVGRSDGVLLWNWATGSSREIPLQSVEALAFSPNGKRLAVSDWRTLDKAGNLIPVRDRHTIIRILPLDASAAEAEVNIRTVQKAMLFTDETTLLSGDEEGTVTFLDPVNLAHRRSSLQAHQQAITGLSLLAGQRIVVSASEDATIRFWSKEDYRLISTIQHPTAEDWLVFTQSGVFDSASLERSAGLAWKMADDPLRPLPPEIFMRDYFEPRLLPRLLACREAERARPDACANEFKRVRPLSHLNRAQPKVRIVRVMPEPDTADEVSVAVEVNSVEERFGTTGQERAWQSGAYDLRLFRDGQLVRQAPDLVEPEPLDVSEPEADVARWRESHRLVEGVGRKELTFRHIRLPRREQGSKIEFSAYAFNVDRVKSTTANMPYTVPQRMPARDRRAYVVAVGVSAYEDPAWDLKYADDDARRLGEVLEPRLKASGQYKDVVTVPLLADWTERDGARAVTEAAATKANVKAVLDILAGRDMPEEVRRDLPNGMKLDRVGPDDLVLIAFSSHGYADKAGNFYLFPYNIGSNTGKAVSTDILRRAISSAELSAWLRDVDAGELIMVVDACHSAASVENSEFKPGPMGSRGLGQLAYDKGMRILASTRANDVAWESARTRQGLLSYALVHDGLEKGKADFRPADGHIGVQEWLEYAAQRVPQLYSEAMSPGRDRLDAASPSTGATEQGWLVAFDSRTRSPRYITRPGASPRTQQPSLFNYKHGSDPLLAIR